MTAGLAVGLITILVVFIGGALLGLVVRGFINVLGRWGAPLARNRGWVALVACIGCFAWYPLHGTVSAMSAVVSFLFAAGMFSVIVY